MVKRIWQVWSLAALVAIGCGCRTGNWVRVNQLIPPEVNPIAGILNDSDYLLISGDDTPLPASTIDEINVAMHRQPSVAGDAEDSEREGVCTVDAWSEYRSDHEQELPFNLRYTVEKKVEMSQSGEELSGHEYIGETKLVTDSSSHLVAISVYSCSPREPVGYSIFHAFDSEAAVSEEHKKEEGAHSVELRENIINRLKSQCLIEALPVLTFIPKQTSKIWNQRLCSETAIPPSGWGLGGAKEIDNQFKSEYGFFSLADMRVALAYIEVRDDVATPKPLFASKIASTSKKRLMSDYYSYLLMKERGDLRPRNLRRLFFAHSAMLGATDDKSLIEAFASSLARIEMKARRLNISLK